MTTPTPTEADKRAAKRIIGVYAEYDLEGVAQTERIIAEEMSAEREALIRAKNALKRVTGIHAGGLGSLEFRTGPQRATFDECLRALTAIEKVTG